MKLHKRFRSYVLEIPVNAAGATATGSYAIDIASEFTVCSISGININASTVRLWDSNSNNLWTMDAVLGSSFTRLYNAVLRDPVTYIAPRTLPANTTVYFEVVDDAATYATPYIGQLVLHGYDWVAVEDAFVTPEVARNMSVQFKVYSVTATREANQSMREILRVDRSRFFVITALHAVSTGAFEVEFSDTRFNNEWSNARIASQAVTGTAQHPFTLPVPVIFEKNTSIFYDVRDTSGAANSVQLAFIGYEVL